MDLSMLLPINISHFYYKITYVPPSQKHKAEQIKIQLTVK